MAKIAFCGNACADLAVFTAAALKALGQTVIIRDVHGLAAYTLPIPEEIEPSREDFEYKGFTYTQSSGRAFGENVELTICSKEDFPEKDSDGEYPYDCVIMAIEESARGLATLDAGRKYPENACIIVRNASMFLKKPFVKFSKEAGIKDLRFLKAGPKSPDAYARLDLEFTGRVRCAHAGEDIYEIMFEACSIVLPELTDKKFSRALKAAEK